MKYPRLKPELDDRKKLMPNDILEIKRLRKKGIGLQKIADIFGVSNSTIFYHTNRNYNEMIKREATETSKIFYHNNKEYCRRCGKELARKLRKKHKEWRGWHIQLLRENRRKKKLEKLKGRQKENWRNQKELIEQTKK